ncbi:hypothetical protein GCWU000324_02127 [Kingella oralis ATCC 51147]|uniref:Uncharacterized protein n=1 Tax=Kingella oralis ATCC 51147 TaxID=629741 RepID=C4GJA5_9NEIS|nr:hypothetical protein GCWU000324_02127 [Kingella oralis ATCC 51147]
MNGFHHNVLNLEWLNRGCEYKRFQAALPSPLQFAIIRTALRVGNSMPTCCLQNNKVDGL